MNSKRSGISSFRPHKRLMGRLLAGLMLLITAMNLTAYLHAWNFTHFTSREERTRPPEELTAFEKIGVILTGVSLPRPENYTVPEVTYESHMLAVGRDSIAVWEINSSVNKGTIALFHGYFADRTSLLSQAERFRRLGYRTVLVDFRGSGASSGSSTTIGYHEKKEVETVYHYLKDKYPDGPLVLFGTSMGAAAILHAASEQDIHPDGIILECPFGSLYEATANRFRSMNLPEIPMAGLLVFWGGVQNGYWGFGHNPSDYARRVDIPVLLFYGELDQRVTRAETEAIYSNLAGQKRLVTFPQGGHGNFLENYESEWMKEIFEFLEDLPPRMITKNKLAPPPATVQTNLPDGKS